MSEPSTCYQTIVADPPWPFTGTWGGSRALVGQERDRRRKPATPYPTMSVESIAALPVAALTAPDAHLYLWTTNRFLWEAKGVAEAWGFRFSQLLVWAKTPMGKGPGGAFASSAEYIVFCRRGSLPHQEKIDSTWFNWPRTGRHSRKPDAMFDMAERVSPGPYLEMFARRRRIGWDAWGDEVESTVELAA